MDRRVRTGCGTCRRRRVKCDEARPICNRCRSANFHCEGYPAPRRAGKTSPTPSPKQAHSPERTSISELSLRHRDWRQEQLPLYHHFVTTTVLKLFRKDHLSFWRDQVAQMSYGLDLVYEGVLAVGAVHRASLMTCQEGNGLEAANFKVLGLRAYGKTIKLLPSYLSHNTVPDTLAALVVLMLLAYFECFLENPKGAFRHLWAAIQLLRNSEKRLSVKDVSNMVPVIDAMLHLDFLAQNLVPYACSSFLPCSDQAMMESPFWNRSSPEFSGVSQSDAIAAERYRLMWLVCAHNKLSRVIWACWCPASERPTRDELMGFYSEMVLWRATSPATFSGFEGLYSIGASDITALASLPMPLHPYLFSSNEAALNVAMYNGYLGCAVAMINTTDPDPEARELEAFNLVYQNLCIASGLVERHKEKDASQYKPCDSISMGICLILYHGTRRCFSLAWQKWTVAALRQIGREGLSNGLTFANTAEIMWQLESKRYCDNTGQLSDAQENNYLGPIRERLIPLLMPRGGDDQFLAFYFRYGNSDYDGDERTVRVVAKATWKQDVAGNMNSLKIHEYGNDGGLSSRNRPQALELFSSWRQAVEKGWHGYLSNEIQDGFLLTQDGLNG